MLEHEYLLLCLLSFPGLSPVLDSFFALSQIVETNNCKG